MPSNADLSAPVPLDQYQTGYSTQLASHFSGPKHAFGEYGHSTAVPAFDAAPVEANKDGILSYGVPGRMLASINPNMDDADWKIAVDIVDAWKANDAEISVEGIQLLSGFSSGLEEYLRDTYGIVRDNPSEPIVLTEVYQTTTDEGLINRAVPPRPRVQTWNEWFFELFDTAEEANAKKAAEAARYDEFERELRVSHERNPWEYHNDHHDDAPSVRVVVKHSQREHPTSTRVQLNPDGATVNDIFGDTSFYFSPEHDDARKKEKYRRVQDETLFQTPELKSTGSTIATTFDDIRTMHALGRQAYSEKDLAVLAFKNAKLRLPAPDEVVEAPKFLLPVNLFDWQKVYTIDGPAIFHSTSRGLTTSESEAQDKLAVQELYHSSMDDFWFKSTKFIEIVDADKYGNPIGPVPDCEWISEPIAVYRKLPQQSFEYPDNALSKDLRLLGGEAPAPLRESPATPKGWMKPRILPIELHPKSTTQQAQKPNDTDEIEKIAYYTGPKLSTLDKLKQTLRYGGTGMPTLLEASFVDLAV